MILVVQDPFSFFGKKKEKKSYSLLIRPVERNHSQMFPLVVKIAASKLIDFFEQRQDYCNGCLV